jgi:hopanoid biosynthesis associated RND transporter like protein HpnN
MPLGPGDHSGDGLISRVLQEVTRKVSRRPWRTLGLVCVLTLASLGVTARFLQFKTSRADLIDPDASFHQRWLRYAERFGDQADAVVAVEGQVPESVRAALDDLGSAVEREPELFDRVLYRLDPAGLQSKSLQYLTPQQLEAGLRRLASFGPILDGHWDRAGLESYARRLAAHLRQCTARGDTSAQVETAAQARRLLRSLDEFLQDPHGFTNPWPEVLPPPDESAVRRFEPRYLLNDDGTMGFLLATARDASRDFSGTSRSIDRLREIIGTITLRHPGVSIGLTGIPVLEADEMRKSQSDMTLATLISFAGVGLLFLIGFRGVRHPLLGLLMLAVGIAWSLGFTTLTVGHLNILSMSFATILIGLGIDYAICYLARYLGLRHQGLDLRSALIRSSAEVGTGIVTVALTTSLAFLCATFTNFLGVAELGIISAGGILLCAVATFTVVPALVTVADRNVEPQRLPTPFQGTWLRTLTTAHPRGLTLATLLIIAGVGACAFDVEDGRLASRVRYDANLLKLQAKDIDSVRVLDRIFEKSGSSLLYAVSMADGPAAARRLRQKFEALPSVRRVEELGSYLPAFPPAETQLLVQAFHTRLSNVSALPRHFPQLDPAAVGQALEQLLEALQAAGLPEAAPSVATLDRLLDRLEQLPLTAQVQALSGYQYAMLTALREQFLSLAAISDPAPVTADDLPEALRRRFVSPRGDWLVQVYPESQIWEEQPLERFVADVRSVDPEATGTPLQNFEAARQIRESYMDAAVYALVVTCLVLLIDALDPGPLWVTLLAPLGVIGFAVVSIHGVERSLDPVWLAGLYAGVALAVAAVFDFQNVRFALLALLPPLAGGFLMFGILGLIDVDLNPANLIVLPLLLGMGIDCGVHVLHDYRLQSGPYQTNPSTMNTVILTSTTTIVGFAAMLGASHKGLVSIGLVLVIGVTCCLFVSLVTLPAILTILSQRALADRGAAPDEPQTPPAITPLRPPLRRAA